jgi:hypothetical protein
MVHADDDTHHITTLMQDKLMLPIARGWGGYNGSPFAPHPFAFPYPVLKPSRRAYGQGHEAQAVKKELDGFAFSQSRAWKAITDHFGSNLRLRELKAMVNSLLIHIRETTGETLPEPSRNAKRSVGLLVKYIESHYDRLVPYFPSIVFCDDNKAPIPYLDATQTRDAE